ncbi:uncharacterized protein LOC141585950 [Silene latifolia]|uniref:uncharacterized protein LOC141585950 n=1 Tax=Silene latifolia TaxID=37657 RepID=UPI003D771C52
MDEKTREMLKNLPHPPREIIVPPSNYGSGRKRTNTIARYDSSSCKVNFSHSFITHEDSVIDDQEEFKTTLWQELAVVALLHHYERQGIKLELFGEVSTNPVFQGDICCFHLDFQAKSEDDIGSSPKTMFAEVFRSDKGEVRVTFCGIMDPSDPELLKGCCHCSKKKLHPPGMKFFKFAKAFGLGAKR